MKAACERDAAKVSRILLTHTKEQLIKEGANRLLIRQNNQYERSF